MSSQWLLTEDMQQEVLETAMYYLHWYGSVYPFMISSEAISKGHNNYRPMEPYERA